jgi:hypothetical protein
MHEDSCARTANGPGIDWEEFDQIVASYREVCRSIGALMHDHKGPYKARVFRLLLEESDSLQDQAIACFARTGLMDILGDLSLHRCIEIRRMFP